MVKFLLRLPDELHATMKMVAKKRKRSLHSEILVAMEFYLEHKPLEEAKPLKKKRTD